MKNLTFTICVIAFMALPVFAQSDLAPDYGTGTGWWIVPGIGYGPSQGYGMAPGYGMSPGYGVGPMYGYAPAPMQGWRNSNAPGRGRFASTDANEDGFVSDEEAASNVDMVFTAMDADDDGFLTIDEFMAVRMGPGDGVNPVRQEEMQARKAERFDPMDSDTDGKVSKSEFMTASQARFKAADVDGDGKVTPWEMRSSVWN